MDDTDGLVAELAGIAGEGRTAVREVLARAVRTPRLVAGLGSGGSGLTTLYRSDTLTVLDVVWPPEFCLFPHDHRMWAAIAVYGGREDNAFFRRAPSGLEAAGGRTLGEGDVLLLGADAIHSVENPATRHTGAIHVYGGDFFGVDRSQWDPATMAEEPWDIEAVREQFARAEARAGGVPDTGGE